MRQNNPVHKSAYFARTCIILLGVMCVLSVSCRRKTRLHAPAVTDRAAFPVLETDSVISLISDSGITRYRIKTPRWQIFDKAEPSYWLFPKGILLERFTPSFSIDASLQANYAKYMDKQELWELRGNVDAVNEIGERFQTEQLFWDQHAERIWSDSNIVITRESSVISGVGFESDQKMTNYTILHPTGWFPIKE